jgi:hypothetical protein
MKTPFIKTPCLTASGISSMMSVDAVVGITVKNAFMPSGCLSARGVFLAGNSRGKFDFFGIAEAFAQVCESTARPALEAVTVYLVPPFAYERHGWIGVDAVDA